MIAETAAAALLAAAFAAREKAGRLDDDVDAERLPRQAAGRPLGQDLDVLAVDDEFRFASGDAALKPAVHAVVFQQIGEVHRVRQVVDGDDVELLRPRRHHAKHQPADAAKTVDADFHCHGSAPRCRCRLGANSRAQSDLIPNL